MPIAYHHEGGTWHATSVERPGWVVTGESLRDLMDAVRAERG